MPREAEQVAAGKVHEGLDAPGNKGPELKLGELLEAGRGNGLPVAG